MQKNSTYNKIHEVLQKASRHAWPLSRLAKSIKNNTRAFVYYKRDKDAQVKEFICELSTVRRQIRFCVRLGLLESEEKCTLTVDGRNAMARGKKRFDLQLQLSVISFFEENGLSIKKIESAIEHLMLPDTDSLYTYLVPNLPQDTFRTCLFLLSECGRDSRQNILKPFDKKIYLTESKLKKAISILERGK